MSQSEWIAAILIAGFIIYLAARNRLSAYWSLLLGGGAAPAPTAASGTNPATGQPNPPAFPGGPTGDVLTGPGLTGHSTSSGDNTTSAPTIGNFMQWLQKNYPDFSKPAPVPANPFAVTPAQ